MKCPKCHRECCTYVEQHKKSGSANKGAQGKNAIPPRTNFQAKCNKCGWSGEI